MSETPPMATVPLLAAPGANGNGHQDTHESTPYVHVISAACAESVDGLES